MAGATRRRLGGRQRVRDRPDETHHREAAADRPSSERRNEGDAVTIIPIRTHGDPVLRQPTRPVEAFDAALRTLYEDMLETMYDAPGVGLAATQVGLAVSFFVFDDARGNGPAGVANPVITLLGGEQTDDEGCLSIPGLYYPTTRDLRARVAGQDIDGKPIALEGEGLLARIFQHETDHLKGMLFIDRLTDDDRRQAMAMVREMELADPKRRLFRRSRKG
jgi:peptide deformylase